jgi:hypothetical protein
MPLGITRNLVSWRFQDHYVERVMDNAAYTSAHPDDTLVLAGPARKDQALIEEPNGKKFGSLLAIGMMQNLNISQVKSTTPVMAIGSGRSFFVSGKAQGNGSIARLFVNGRNLMRVLYHNAVSRDLPVESFDDPAAVSSASKFYINLDSELYLIPFGLGSIFRTKSHQFVGGFYAELTMLQSYNISIQAGANMIAEQVSFMFDRLVSFASDDLGTTSYIPKATLDSVLGFVDDTSEDVAAENLSSSTVSAAV